MEYLKMKLIRMEKDLPNMILAFLSSFWVLPFALTLFYLLSAGISGLELNSRTFKSMLSFMPVVGHLWLFISWFIWSFILIKRFRAGHLFRLKEKVNTWRYRYECFLSIGWLFVWWGFIFLYCTLRMRDQSIDLISSGAHTFYFIRSGFNWTFLFFSMVLWRLLMSLLKRL